MKLRLPKLVAVILALASCGSGGVASFAACQRASRVAAHDAARHDCCHPHLVKRATQTINATHGDHESRSGCTARDDAARIEPTDDEGLTRASCCDGLPARTSAPAVAATNDTTSRTRLSHLASTHPCLAPDAPLLCAVPAPLQHAPPAPAARLHILISVLLI